MRNILTICSILNKSLKSFNLSKSTIQTAYHIAKAQYGDMGIENAGKGNGSIIKYHIDNNSPQANVLDMVEEAGAWRSIETSEERQNGIPD